MVQAKMVKHHPEKLRGDNKQVLVASIVCPSCAQIKRNSTILYRDDWYGDYHRNFGWPKIL